MLNEHELTIPEWIDLVSSTHGPAPGERVVITARLRKGNVLLVKKPWMHGGLPGIAGLGLKRGNEIEVVSGNGANKVVLPAWAVKQLSLGSHDVVCITERDSKYYLKRLDLVERPSRIPGRFIIDSFNQDRVCRTFTQMTDLRRVTNEDAKTILAEMGRLRHDPLGPLGQVQGGIGWIARKELLDGLTAADKSAIEGHKKEILADQEGNGSWEGSTVRTAFNIIRLTQVEATRRLAALRKGTDWLLSTPEPDGLPGVFMFSPELTEEFNAWRAEGNIGRFTPDGKQKRHRDHERHEFGHGGDIGYPREGCEPRFIWPTAVCVEALLRAGLHAHPRVGQAINTSLAGSEWDGWRASNFGKPWCGCAGKVLGGGLVVEKASGRADFNGPVAHPDVLACLNFEGIREPWEYATVNSRRGCVAATQGRALWIQEGTGTCGTDGNCTTVMHRAMSLHPAYAGSNLETTAILNFRGVHRSYSLVALEWLADRPGPLSALFVLRSIPHLIRCQEEDGLWPASQGRTREEASVVILRALKRHGFLDALLPVSSAKGRRPSRSRKDGGQKTPGKTRSCRGGGKNIR